MKNLNNTTAKNQTIYITDDEYADLNNYGFVNVKRTVKNIVTDNEGNAVGGIKIKGQTVEVGLTTENTWMIY